MQKKLISFIFLLIPLLLAKTTPSVMATTKVQKCCYCLESKPKNSGLVARLASALYQIYEAPMHTIAQVLACVCAFLITRNFFAPILKVRAKIGEKVEQGRIYIEEKSGWNWLGRSNEEEDYC